MNHAERIGTVNRDMVSRYYEAGLKELEFRVTEGFVTVNRRKAREATPEVTPMVRLCRLAKPECSVSNGLASTLRRLARAVAGEVAGEVTGEENCRTVNLVPALELGLVEMTRPDVPRSRLQKYRLKPKGRAALKPGKPA